ncbi:GspE/PulE family protein [Peptostreptococcus canis]|uniref:Type II/IV secretion system protein n=1 Tax=Peptostreptococcus canis TaxID=1159213 RepID=A0ABR6TL83_9FIRM|nr:GspE/PulE family protein [Peptostreptococcus canis]MBC2576169.1 type II/IV secretion system protein [Peptostreptococcus canis]MBP1998298.1 type IV pilus assembly protein PilB [Peptostreptococcus canis]
MEKILSSIISEKYAYKNCVFPLEISESKLVVQMKSFDINTVNTLRANSGREVVVKYASESLILENIRKNYSNIKREEDEHLNSYIKELIENAVNSNASDIHLEPFNLELRIRYRINGDLNIIDKLSLDDYPKILTMIKLRAGCDITEKRVPQDGRFTYSSYECNIDIRVSTVPTVHGEKTVLRLLNRNNFIRTKSELGFLPDAVEKIDKILENKSGILIVSGATGSGKSTTVYSLLNELNKMNINITTIEDPVEYRMEGINQIQVNSKTGVRFDNGLRAILRQDPDCIVLGEIRDNESARIAIRAAMTGHLVIASLHTNDAISSVVRLRDMGIEPYLISSTLIGVISQKLVKRGYLKKISQRNSDLKIEKSINEKSRGRKNFDAENISKKDERILIYEVLTSSPEFISAVRSECGSDDLKRIAIKSGMITYEKSIREKAKRERNNDHM